MATHKRVYVNGYVQRAQKVQLYFAKHEATMNANLSPSAEGAAKAFADAAAAFVNAVNVDVPGFTNPPQA